MRETVLKLSARALVLAQQQAVACEGHFCFHAQPIEDLLCETASDLALWTLLADLRTAYADLFHQTVLQVPVVRLHHLVQRSARVLATEVRGARERHGLAPNRAIEDAVATLLRRMGAVLPTLHKMQCPHFTDSHRERVETLLSREANRAAMHRALSLIHI